MELDEAFKGLFDEVKKSRDNVYVAACITESDKDDHIRMSMWGDSDSILAAICLVIHEYSKKTHESTTETLLRISGALSEEE